MKKFIIAIIILSLISVSPINYISSSKAEAAITKFIVKADAEYIIAPGEKITLYVKTKKVVTWSSSDKTVATVSKKGVVTGKAEGTTTITAKVDKKKYKCAVTIKNFSDWILFKTDIFDLVRNGMLIGEVIYYKDDYYYISPEYYKDVITPWMNSVDESYKKDIAERNYKNKFDSSTLTPDAVITFKKDKSSSSTDEEDLKSIKIEEKSEKEAKEAKTKAQSKAEKFAKEWIGEEEILSAYGIKVYWDMSDYQIQFTKDNNSIFIINLPKIFQDEHIYTFENVNYQHIGKYYASDPRSQFYFKREDLINKGIIK